MDWVLLALVLVLALRGWWVGSFAQLCTVIGVVLGIVTLDQVRRAVGAHWAAARPALVYQAMALACGVLAGAFVLALAQWIGQRSRGAIESTAWRPFDRAFGVVFGAGMGMVLALTVLCVALSAPLGLRRTAARSVSAAPLLELGRPLGQFEARVRAGRSWITSQLDAAERRRAAARSTF